MIEAMACGTPVLALRRGSIPAGTDTALPLPLAGPAQTVMETPVGR